MAKPKPLSWQEIRTRAVDFTREWRDEICERSEAQTFWNEFFEVFGKRRRGNAYFEHHVIKDCEKRGYIDLFWPGELLVEHKSAGKDLDRAFTQAMKYFPGIEDHEIPKYVIVSDYRKFKLYDLEGNETHEFHIDDLYKNVKLFGWIAGYKKPGYYNPGAPVNRKAAETMGRIYDSIRKSGYNQEHLEEFMVRLLFCLFADDTTLFPKDSLRQYIDLKLADDGSDLGPFFIQLFQVLNKSEDKRQQLLDDFFLELPYVNGSLFSTTLETPALDASVRKMILACCSLDWSAISPAVFGSMFQTIMESDDPEKRRNLGAHYTSEENILKVINSLFLDDLKKVFNKVKNNKNKLKEFHQKIAQLQFLDPACGCGNFLVITYRELRKMEIEINKILLGPQTLFVYESWFKVSVKQFHGIEVEKTPARIGKVAMWLMEHLMNLELMDSWGYFVKLPLTNSANIISANAIDIDWNGVVLKNEIDYVIGNPPFIGKTLRNDQQKLDLENVASGVKGAGVLDYAACWYFKAADYIHSTRASVAFVTTNSISQGEQPGILWNHLFKEKGMKIHFAHQTFQWTSGGKGAAAVHVVIIGFANYDVKEKQIFSYPDIKSEPTSQDVKNINPYLVEGGDLVVLKRRTPLCDVTEISFGNMPNDGGHLILTKDERAELLKSEPRASKFIKSFPSAHGFLNGDERYCIWLDGVMASEYRNLKTITDRIKLVKQVREASKRAATNKLADTPSLFGERRQPKSNFLLIPRVSSQNRKYIPMGYFNSDVIVSDTCLSIDNATLYEFGVLHSEMHMAWVRATAGRLKSDFRYSNEIVYNNFPWPKPPNEQKIQSVQEKAQSVLDLRAGLIEKGESLADIYDSNSMHANIVKAHKELSKAVDICYRPQKFTSDTNRQTYLFDLYQEYLTE